MKQKRNFEHRIKAIEQRNQRVELDKVWETSWTRRLTITGLTYFVVAAYLEVINNNQPFINALVPAAGFLLSTLVLRKLRTIWQKNKAKS